MYLGRCPALAGGHHGIALGYCLASPVELQVARSGARRKTIFPRFPRFLEIVLP